MQAHKSHYMIITIVELAVVMQGCKDDVFFFWLRLTGKDI